MNRNEKLLILKGMKETGKKWAKKADHSQFHPLGIQKAKELYSNGILFFDNTEENIKKAHYKICGHILQKGEGVRMLIYASDFYHLSFYYSCNRCKLEIEKEK